MPKNDPKPTRTFGRPADRSFEAFKQFVNDFADALGIPKNPPLSEAKAEQAWRRFWEQEDKPSSSRPSEPGDGPKSAP